MRKFLLASICVACVGPILASGPLAASVQPNARAPRAVTPPLRAHAMSTRQGQRPRGALDVPTCTGAGFDSIVGGGLQNVAAGDYAAVLGGFANEACGSYDAIGGGSENGSSGFGNSIAGGEFNGSTGFDGFLGAGVHNSVAGYRSFVGAGAYNAASADGAFVGAGGEVYDQTQHNSPPPGNVASGKDSFVGAGDLNQVSGQGSFIGAGGSTYAADGVPGPVNYVSGTDSFIGAGDANYIGADDDFIGGGLGNIIATGTYAAIAGGRGNAASGTYGAVAGGYRNSATGTAASVGGGSSSAATGKYATIPGGYLNAANGIGSFAAGSQAKARHNGAFVWSDNNGTAAVQSSADYQFVARASGGFYLFTDATAKTGVKLNPGSGAWASLSDRTMKSGVVALDDAAVLAKVAALPVSEWSYTAEHGVRHVGPMAQDFYAAFHVGEDDRHITSIDEDGVALAAIKALAEGNHGLHAENRELHQENLGLRERLTRQDARLAALEREVAALAAR